MMIDTQKYKQKLEEEKKLLLEELQSVGSPRAGNPEDWDPSEEENPERADLNVKADVEEELEEKHAITDTLEARLQSVNLALVKIEKGEYGVCEMGGEQIEEDRLNANPAAQTCKVHLNS